MDKVHVRYGGASSSSEVPGDMSLLHRSCRFICNHPAHEPQQMMDGCYFVPGYADTTQERDSAQLSIGRMLESITLIQRLIPVNVPSSMSPCFHPASVLVPVDLNCTVQR